MTAAKAKIKPTAKPTTKARAWTKAEDRAVLSHKYSVAEIAARLDRSYGAVSNRRCRLLQAKKANV